MTTEVVTAKEPVNLEDANKLLKHSKKGKLPVVNNEGNVSFFAFLFVVGRYGCVSVAFRVFVSFQKGRAAHR